MSLVPPSNEEDTTMPMDKKDAEQGVRCDECGAYFSSEALRIDHQQLHLATTEAERASIFADQNERKP